MYNINLKLGIGIFVFFKLVFLVGRLPQDNKSSKDNFPVLKEPYLGQKPPGLSLKCLPPVSYLPLIIMNTAARSLLMANFSFFIIFKTGIVIYTGWIAVLLSILDQKN